MSSEGGTDILTLIAGDLHADLAGYVKGDGRVETCLDDFIAIHQDDAPNAAVLVTDDGLSARDQPRQRDADRCGRLHRRRGVIMHRHHTPHYGPGMPGLAVRCLNGPGIDRPSTDP